MTHEKEMKALELENRQASTPETNQSNSRRASAPKLPFFNESRDDLDAYLERFERFATSQNWPQDEWATDLSALLTGKALETYYRMPSQTAGTYKHVKQLC